MDIREITSLDELPSLRGEWNALLNQSDSNVVFLTHEYVSSWCEVWAPERELLILAACHNSRTVGIAPLVIRRSRRLGVGRRIVEFAGTLHSDYLDVIAGEHKPAVLNAVYAHLWSIRNRWDVVRLREIPDTSSTVGLSTAALDAAGIPFEVTPASTCPVISLDGQDRDAVLKNFLRRKSLRNNLNRLQRDGHVEYGYADCVEEALAYLDVFFQYHINRWETTLTPSVFHRPNEREFFRRLVRSLLPAGWLRLAYLNVNGRPIALFFGFEYNRSLSQLRPAYDPMCEKLSPGRILNFYAVQDCLDRGLRDYDLLAGLEEYKNTIANSTRQNQSLFIHKSGAGKALHRVKRRVQVSRPVASYLGNGRLGVARLTLRRYVARYGAAGLVGHALRRFTSRIYDRSSNQIYVWRGRSPGETHARCQLEIRRGDERDVNWIASFQGWPQDCPHIEDLRRRLNQGDIPYLAISGKTLANVSWLCRRPEVEMGEIWGSVTFRDDQAYIMDCKTHTLFRGMNVYPVLLRHILKDLQCEGVTTVFIACRTSNVASTKGILKAGFEPHKRVIATRILGRKLGPRAVPAE